MNVIYCKSCESVHGCDDVFISKIDRYNWYCDKCNQPERSKREDHHLTLDDFSDNPTKKQLGEEMRKKEREILDAVL